MRYLLALSFRGTNYVGWQRQPNGLAVQEVLETTFYTITRQVTPITGCGRTDAGVHARQFFAHLDLPDGVSVPAIDRLNRVLPRDIVVHDLTPVDENFNARFEAMSRSYEYHLTSRPDPFRHDLVYRYPRYQDLDLELLDQAAALLLSYTTFFPFCKTRSGVNHYRCDLMTSYWSRVGDHSLCYHVTANRFLRGMVRLIVGMCLQVGSGRLNLEKVADCLANQTRLKESDSAPAHGLFLTQVLYP